MEVGGFADPRPSRGVSFFSDALESDLAGASASSSAEARFTQKLEQTTSSEAEPSQEPADAMPIWMMLNAAPASEELANTEDIMEEFLQDDDMLNLEVICAKWRGVDEADLEGISKILPDTANNLLLADKHIQEFLSYRRQLNEKHTRKTMVKNKMELDRKSIMQQVAEDSDSDRDDDSPEPNTPTHPSGAARKSVAAGDRSSFAATAKGRKSIVPQPVGQPTLALPQRPERRGSVSTVSPRLAQAGKGIIGQEEPPAPDSQPGSVGKRSMAEAAPRASMMRPGRRGSVSSPDKDVASAPRASQLAPSTSVARASQLRTKS